MLFWGNSDVNFYPRPKILMLKAPR